MGRILAIDYGEKRLGIAISDETKTIALSKPYVSAATREEIIKLVNDYEVEEILIGLPVGLKGVEGESARKARAFGTWIEEQTGRAVKFIDERFSTKEIQREIGKSSRGREIIDSLVAQRMLERYLEIERT